jgi:hypothetical protein
VMPVPSDTKNTVRSVMWGFIKLKGCAYRKTLGLPKI